LCSKQTVMKQSTIYHLVLDQSGSMSDCVENTLNGVNEQIRKTRELTREFPNQEITIGLTIFNDQVKSVYKNTTPSSVDFLTQKEYQPSGSTALFDAIGKTIFQIENDMKSKGDHPTDTAVVIVLTDGYENASRLFSLKDIRESILRLEATGRWTFSFLGATLDAVDVAEHMAFKRHNSFSFEKRDMDADVWNRVNRSMNSYMNKKIRGESLDNLFDEK